MPSPIHNRLKADYEKVKKLVAESGGSLVMLRVKDTPPTQYVLEYHCPSLVKDQQGMLVIRHSHRVEITLGSKYPLQMPTARMLTPVFNPHIFESNAICLGVVWNPGETLDLLILRIGALLQYDPRVLNRNSPANGAANQWAQQNKKRLPLGNVTFKAPASPPAAIEWNA